ncbi:hypothetical protein O3P69_011550 [Scylla paramamosain]|uniref:C2 domain-containing protein n=1 Tax=Scylla paramamosain TaxID=85552 RepID=A0AAW0T9Q5_SCYPA
MIPAPSPPSLSGICTGQLPSGSWAARTALRSTWRTSRPRSLASPTLRPGRRTGQLPRARPPTAAPGQHVHIDYSEASREPAMPLHQLRPPPPPPPRGTRASQGTRKSRTKMPSWQRPEPLLPVIYENTRREETPRAAKKRKLRHLMEIEFSIDDDDDERPGGGTSEVSPRGGSQSSSDIPDSGVSEGLTTPLISPLSGPRSPQSPRSDSLLGEPSTPLSLDQLEGKAGPTENTTPDVPRPRLPHDVTDPGFLECERRGYLSEELQEEAPSSWRCGGRSWVDASPISRGDVSRMLLSAVGRNLFCDSPAEGSPARDNSLGRRHSLGSLADLSRKLSFLGLGDNSTTHGKEASVSREAPLKKAHSVLCLSPTSPVRCTAASISASTSSVPLMAAVAQILKEPEARGSPPCRRWLPADGQTAQNTSVQSGQWWAGGAGEAGEERCATKGSGSAGGQAARPSLSCQPSPRYHHPSCPLSPSQSHPALQTISSNPTLPLPVEMSGGQPLAAGHAGAGLSVPVGPRPEKEAVLATQDVSECDSGCGGDLTPRWDQTSARQRRRREESHYRLQRMLEECPCSLRHGEAEESVSADWSMEAVPDEVSTRDPCDLEAEGSDAVPSPSSLPSPPSPDAVSLCTIDSDYGDGIYVSPRLVEQLRRLTEAKMLARLRKSFRGKKEKRPSENVPTKTSGAPKVGIFMFVDNPMYLSPEVKKEARVVSAHASDKSKSAWYVGNPMYTSPEPHRRDSVPEERQRALCEKENLRNTRLANVVRQNPTGRKPLANLWLQSNPCYESPEAKASTAEDDTYLTPIAVRRPATLADDPNILDVQKFLDHEYCTIPGDDSDSWVTHSSGSRDSDSPAARRSLAFGAPRRDPTTPSRIWRETGKNQHSTPRKPQGSLEKGATLGTRQHRTPRAVKRGRRGVSQEEPRGASPPPLPARPHPPLHPITHDTSLPANTFEDTSDFHHHRPADPREDTAHFQLPPDGIYESVNRGGRRRVTRSYSDVVRASTCSSGPKNGASGSLCEGSQRGKARRRVGRKYRAGEVLQGKGQLKLAVYENYGLLTIHIMEARKLRSRLSSVCNPYVKISLVPDSQERTFCRTPLLRATNTPHFDQKFSFRLLTRGLGQEASRVCVEQRHAEEEE